MENNSSSNPNNPSNPPRDVHFGEQTTDEMCFVFLGATSSGTGRIAQTFFAVPFLGEKKEASKPGDGKPGEGKKP